MGEHKPTGRWRSAIRALGWTAAASAAAIGSVEVAEQWKEVLLGREASGIAQDHGSRAEINRDATLGTVKTVTGNVAQDYSRNVVLYNNAFRLEVVRATGEASAAKQQLRDEILKVFDGLIGEVGARSPSHATGAGPEARHDTRRGADIALSVAGSRVHAGAWDRLLPARRRG